MDFAMLKRASGDTLLSVKVRPGASRTMCKGTLADGTVKIDVAAAPEDGKANAELVRFLARECGVPKDHVRILKGETSPRKEIRIAHR